MMKIQAGKFLDSFSIVANMLDDVIITLNKDGLRINQADRPAICFVDYSLKSNAFEEYSITEEMKICINSIDLKEFLKRFDREELVDIRFDKDGNKLYISNANSKNVKTFDISLLQVPTIDQPDVEKLNAFVKANLSIEFSLLKDTLDDVNAYNKSIGKDKKSSFVPIDFILDEKLRVEYKNYKRVFDIQVLNFNNLFEGGKIGKTRINSEHLDKLLDKSIFNEIQIKLGNEVPIIASMIQYDIKKVGEVEQKFDIMHLKVVISPLFDETNVEGTK